MEKEYICKEEYLENIRNFRLMDDDFMSKVFDNNKKCTSLLVNIILERNDLVIKRVDAQKKIKNLQGRSIILDICAVDNDGKLYNIEVQRSDKGAVPQRARYNSSIIDANITSPGDDYEDLAETYVIFITEKDVLKGNRPIYHIERVIRETGEDFNDGAHIIYVNGENMDDTPLGALMHDFNCKNPDDMKYPELAESTRYFKEDEEGVANMCEMMENMVNKVKEQADKEKAKAVAETSERERIEMARSLLLLGKNSFEEISLCSKLPLEEVKKLAAELGKWNIDITENYNK